ncbi:hypothetical protein Dpep_0038 [Dethiosulfovibrio peptidovorans DSM 11002]|uniref:Uncharacterized protein n=1 Tax=Dethiosulfovibrio peptidovorans DSM 11002 TaxID=469381 RepID=D2Z2B4_9BACT|nr:hypothetical protein [Dethiosulfovibrio peptidovorans]EFC90070.1 hypothetical protein Dpep_0038 [Dethiosulfovibrio peptidovorans DSM 11002]
MIERRCSICGSIIGKVMYLGPRCTDICEVCGNRLRDGFDVGKDVAGQIYLGEVAEGQKGTRSATTERACVSR